MGTFPAIASAGGLMYVHRSRIVSTAAVGILTCLTAGAVSAQSSPWRAVGPAPPAVITPVVVGPSGSGVIYIATFGGGVLRSTDDGRSFVRANNGLPNLSVTSMTAHPGDIRRLYVGTFGAGLFHTRDGGELWTPLATTPAPSTTIAIDPARPSTIYLGLLGGPRLRKSIDGGLTWKDANAGLPNAPVWSIRIDPQNPDVLFAGTGGGGGFKSVDGGASWSRLALPPGVLAFAIDPRNSLMVYGATDGGGVYRSVDGGASFGPADSTGARRVLSLAVDPVRPGVVYAGTLDGGVDVSTDFAQTFRRTALRRGSALVLTSDDAGHVYVGTAVSGVMKSKTLGLWWSPLAAGLLDSINGQNVYGVTVDSQNPTRLLVATNFAGMLETIQGRMWREVNTGYASHTARTAVFDPADGHRVYAGSLYGGGLMVSTDRGRTWTQRTFGSSAVYVWGVAVGPDRAVYAATIGEGLWRSTDLGTSFERVAATPTNDVRGVAIDPGNPSHLLVASNQGLFRSLDGGASWSRLFTTGTLNVVFDPRNPDVVYASTMANGVHRSTDRGASFVPVNNGLTALVTSRGAGVVIDPRNSQVLYIGTETGGVFKSRDSGETWFPINEGLSDLRVFALAIDPRSPDTLYAGGSSSVFKTTTGGEATSR